MKKSQQQKISSSIYDDFTSMTQSVMDRRGQLATSFNNAVSNTLSKIGEIKTNLIYSIKHSDLPIIPIVQRKYIEIRDDGSHAQLLGHRYDAQNQYKMLFVYRNTFWFTYRHGIKEIQSDNGWGCMIRTLQMVFAQTLKRNLKLGDTEKDQYQVIRHFSELSQGFLSLSEICKQGNINKRWTSSLEVIGIFKRIMQKYPEHFKFNIQVFSSGVVYKQIQNQLFQKYPVMISLTNRVSLNNIPEQLHAHYFEMMDNPSWVGAIGGVKGQALYIIGGYDQKVIFLDPHYVQSNDEEMDVQTYFNKTPRGLQISDLSPSISFCYYFETKEQHKKWLEWISNISEKHYPNLVFQYISQKTKEILESKQQKMLKPKGSPTILLHPKKQDSISITVVVDEDLKQKGKTQKSGDYQIIDIQKHRKSNQYECRLSGQISNDSDQFELLI